MITREVWERGHEVCLDQPVVDSGQWTSLNVWVITRGALLRLFHTKLMSVSKLLLTIFSHNSASNATSRKLNSINTKAKHERISGGPSFWIKFRSVRGYSDRPCGLL